MMAEPEWDEATRDLALAFDAVDMCRVCGGPAYLCQDPALQFNWTALDPVRCHAQTARLERAEGITDKTNPQASALIFPVRLNTTGGAR